MCVVWGLPYLFIRVAVEHIAPGPLVFLRTGLGALVLVPVAVSKGQLRPVLARWQWLLLFAVVEVIVPWLLLSDAERHLNSSLAGLLVAAVPLIGALIARFSRHGDRVSPTQLLGLLVGIGGVACLVGLDFGGLRVSALLEMGVVAIAYAVGPVILARTLSDLPSLGVIAAALSVSAIVYLPFAIVQPPDLSRASTITSVVVLGLVCTAAAFLLFFELIATIGPTRSTVITYVNPAVALALGVAVLNEPVTTGMIVGFPLILAGSVLGARGSRPPAQPEPFGESVGDQPAVTRT
ncbi:DMT family transporter [Jatrophihabitans telluris]|uniref:DMT family transporter n=1 Tax=Jatrophihabitans telluris TaxID=2038343 RepID=UPI003221717B